MKRRNFLRLAGGAVAVPAITAPFVSRAVAQQAGVIGGEELRQRKSAGQRPERTSFERFAAGDAIATTARAAEHRDHGGTPGRDCRFKRQPKARRRRRRDFLPAACFFSTIVAYSGPFVETNRHCLIDRRENRQGLRVYG